MSLVVIFLTPVIPLTAQDTDTHSAQNEKTKAMLKEGKMTVAVLDFEGRGISQMEAQTLTDRLSSELANTNAVILVERNQMTEILEEQGFQQSGCTTSECAAEVGALLGVQNMISGSFGKIGNSYTIDAKMFSVETGALVKTVSKTYRGEVDGLITEIEILAWELVDLPPPKELLARQKAGMPITEAKVTEKKGGGWFLWTVLGLAAAGGGAYYYLLNAEQAPAVLPEPPQLP
ncbi:MAG: hypothetical protein GXO92_07295 [FCB group bacterium]|nr:hypothetical protein [FCB group bacterium]